MADQNNEAFIVMQIGAKDSAERRRADELYDLVVTPALSEFGLSPYRADRDYAPGPITPQILRRLVGARLVIADLTGRNPNVFYELGIAHSFALPLVSIVDVVSSLPFDAKDERVIELGAHEQAGLLATQAETAKANLRRSLDVVMAEGYEPPSPLREIAGTASLDALKPEDPLAAELGQLSESISEIRDLVRRPNGGGIPVDLMNSYNAMQSAFERLIGDGRLSADELTSRLITPETPGSHDQWVHRLASRAPVDDPWATPAKTEDPWGPTPAAPPAPVPTPREPTRDPWGAPSPGVSNDDPPF